MRNKLILALALAFVALAPLAAPVKRVEARTGLSVSTYCNSAGHQRLECFGFASGGSGNYYYDWTPNGIYGSEGQDYAIIPCARAYRNQTVYLTVTDLSTGATGSTYTTEFCGDAD